MSPDSAQVGHAPCQERDSGHRGRSQPLSRATSPRARSRVRGPRGASHPSTGEADAPFRGIPRGLRTRAGVETRREPPVSSAPCGESWGRHAGLHWQRPCPFSVHRVVSLLRSRRYQSLVASYGEARRERFLRELAEMEGNVHEARLQAREKLDRHAVEQVVGGAEGPRGPGCGGWRGRGRGGSRWGSPWLPGRGGVRHVASVWPSAPSRCAPTWPCARTWPCPPQDRLAWERHVFEERMRRAPEILVRLRSHTVWERSSVRLCFTVQGFPTPVVQW